MLEPLGQVRAILHRQSDQKRPQSGLFLPDDLVPSQVGFQRLGAPPDRAQGAKQMDLAEPGRVEPHLVRLDVVAEKQMLAAVVEPEARLGVVGPCVVAVAWDSLPDIESPPSCFSIPSYPLR
jgi:hypothetical protein